MFIGRAPGRLIPLQNNQLPERNPCRTPYLRLARTLIQRAFDSKDLWRTQGLEPFQVRVPIGRPIVMAPLPSSKPVCPGVRGAGKRHPGLQRARARAASAAPRNAIEAPCNKSMPPRMGGMNYLTLLEIFLRGFLEPVSRRRTGCSQVGADVRALIRRVNRGNHRGAHRAFRLSCVCWEATSPLPSGEVPGAIQEPATNAPPAPCLQVHGACG